MPQLLTLNIPFHDIASVHVKGNTFDNGAPFDDGTCFADGTKLNDDTATFTEVNAIDNGALYGDRISFDICTL